MKHATIIAGLACATFVATALAEPVPSREFAQYISASCDPLSSDAEYVEHLGIHTTYQLPSPTAGQNLYALTSGDNPCHLLFRSFRNDEGLQSLWLSNQETHSLTTAVYEDKGFMVFARLNADAFQSYVMAQMEHCLSTTSLRDDCIELVRDQVRSSVVVVSWPPPSEGGAYYRIGLFGDQFSHYDDGTLYSARDLVTAP